MKIADLFRRCHVCHGRTHLIADTDPAVCRPCCYAAGRAAQARQERPPIRVVSLKEFVHAVYHADRWIGCELCDKEAA